MKKIQKQLQLMSKTLSGLARQLEKVARHIDAASPTAGRTARPGRPPAKKAPAPGARLRTDTVLESVFNAIRRSRSGLSISQLIGKTKLETRQLSNALYKLSKKKLVCTRARGVYVKN